MALALVFVASTKREAEGGGKEPDDVWWSLKLRLKVTKKKKFEWVVVKK